MYGRHLNVSMYKQSGLFNDREGQKLCVCVVQTHIRDELLLKAETCFCLNTWLKGIFVMLYR